MTGTITINNLKASHALNWSEVTPSMARNMAPFIVGQPAHKMREAITLSQKGKAKNQERIDAANQAYMDCAMPLLWHIIDNHNLKFIKQLSQLQPEHYAMIIGSDENPVKWCMEVKLTKQLFPTIKPAITTTWHGPRDYLKSMKFGEYLYAQQQYSAWVSSQNIQDLKHFFATLYRPERTDVAKNTEAYHDDKREPFLPALVKQRAEKLHGYSQSIMLVAALYWMGCHAQMRNRYTYIFQGTSSKNTDPGDIVVGLAPAPGDEPKVLNTTVHAIMRRLNQEAERAIKRQRA